MVGGIKPIGTRVTVAEAEAAHALLSRSLVSTAAIA